MSGVLARLRSLWRGLRRRRDFEAEMAEEFRHHVELRTQDLLRRGVPPAEASRRARVEFGHVESHKEDARASRGLRPFDQLRFSWLDVKLGLRMLAKYPGLSVVSVLGMAAAIAIGAGAFGAIGAILDPTLPLPGGERMVTLQNNTWNPGNPDRQVLHDFLLWREELTSIDELSAFRSDSRTLITPAGDVELVSVAEMTASGFRVAGVPPLLGRPLLQEDERAGAPPVLVLGHDAWQRRFDTDPDIIGRPVRLGTVVHTVVGVMPDGFRFPISHQYWVPLRLDASAHERGGGPSLYVFGRLAAGVSMEEAQAELTTIGGRLAAEYPDTHEGLRPQVLRYAHAFVDVDSPVMALVFRAFQLAVSLVLVLVALNVAILVYARTTTRTGEIAVRSALGASRRRVVTQLFAEALVLSGLAALIGLTIATLVLEGVQQFHERSADYEFPFWLDLGLSAGLVAYTTALAVLGGVIIGVVPALKATGRRVLAGLQQLSPRGSGMQLGRTWTALIVLQVAAAVAVLPSAIYIAGRSLERGTARIAYPAHEILRAWLSMEREEAPPAAALAAYDSASQARFRDRAGALIRRLRDDAAVAGVTFASQFPGGGRFARIQVEGAEAGSVGGVILNGVAPDLFTVFDVPIVAGRGFVESDAREGAAVVIVDRVFVERVLGGGDVLGRRIRRVLPPPPGAEPGEVETGPWLEIVGVVPEFTVQNDFEPSNPKLYQPLALAGAPPVLALAVRVRGSPAATFARPLREITAGLDPALQLHELRSAADAEREVQLALRYLGLGVAAVTLCVLLLSAAGIYAMMSFTVARRRREIGIRSALGAAPRLLLGGIFARAAAQLGAGVLAGLAVAAALHLAIGDQGPLSGRGVLLLPTVAAAMMLVGLIAALGPARRGLAIQPTEALREE